MNRLKKIKLINPVLLLITVLLSLGQLQRLQLGIGLAIYLHELVLAGWLASWLLVKKPTFTLPKQASIRWLYLVTIAWLLFGWLKVVWQGIELSYLVEASLRVARLGLYASWGYLLWRVQPPKIAWYLMLWGGLLWFWGLLQYFLLPDTRFLAILGWDDHLYRLISTQFDPNFTGLLLGLSCILWLHLSSKKLKTAWIWGGVFAIVGAIALTYSRASYLSLAVGLAWLAGRLKKPLWLIIPVIGLLLVMPFLPKPSSEGTNLGRVASIQARLTDSQQHRANSSLLLGDGLFLIPENFTSNQPDHARLPNDLPTLVLSQTGLVGVVLSLIWLWHVWRWLQPVPLVQASLLMILSHSLFNQSLLQPFILAWLLLLTAGFKSEMKR